MYTITENKDGIFILAKDGAALGGFRTHADAAKAQEVNEKATGTWVDDGKGTAYPAGTDGHHSGNEKLTGESRFDALVNFLRDKHGIHVPEEIAAK